MCSLQPCRWLTADSCSSASHPSKRSSPTRVMHNFSDYAPDVAIPLRCIQHSVCCWAFPVECVRAEHTSASFSLSSDNSSHLRKPPVLTTWARQECGPRVVRLFRMYRPLLYSSYLGRFWRKPPKRKCARCTWRLFQSLNEHRQQGRSRVHGAIAFAMTRPSRARAPRWRRVRE